MLSSATPVQLSCFHVATVLNYKQHLLESHSTRWPDLEHDGFGKLLEAQLMHMHMGAEGDQPQLAVFRQGEQRLRISSRHLLMALTQIAAPLFLRCLRGARIATVDVHVVEASSLQMCTFSVMLSQRYTQLSGAALAHIMGHA